MHVSNKSYYYKLPYEQMKLSKYYAITKCPAQVARQKSAGFFERNV